MKIPNISKLFFKQKTNTGFTLTELLIGAAITSIVVGAAGFGLVQIMKTSQTGNSQAERRSEVARAYDFISDEIRRARLVEDDTNISTDATNFTSTDKEVVLVLKIPVPDIDVNKDGTIDAHDNRDRDGVDNNEANVIYYVSSPPSGSVWQGPKVLYRWGPPISNNGEYTNGNWVEQPLIDKLDETATDLDDGNDPDCEADDWTASEAPGFAACIDPGGKTAQLFINGEILKSTGDGIYSANTKTTARANIVNMIPSSDPEGRNYALGGEFACNSSTSFNMTTTIAVGGSSPQQLKTGESVKSSDLNITKGKTVTVTSTPSAPAGQTCNQLTSTTPVSISIAISDPQNPATNYPDYTIPTTNSKVKVFKNGDVIDIEEAYNLSTPPQQTLKDFLADRGVQFDYDTVNDQYLIKLDNNKLLIAFEIGQTNQYLDSPNDTIKNPGYDFQDNLVLITVK